MSDVVARKFRDPVHHFERLRDDLLQEVRLFANYFAGDLICKKQDALQPIGKAQQHLVAFILFLHELNSLLLPLLLIRQERARTSNVTLATPKIAFEIGFN